MQAQLENMLRLQDELNILTNGSDWRTKGLNFNLAIQQECAELIDHIGWKWWAKQVRNEEAAEVEVVDMLHFALSNNLCCALPIPAQARTIAARLREKYSVFWLADDPFDKPLNPITMDIVSLASAVSCLAGMGRGTIDLIFVLGEKLNMSFDTVAKLYQSKLVLNTFRQLNGYKTGDYAKIWRIDDLTAEDNVHMQKIADNLDWSDPAAPNHLYEELNKRYRYVKTGTVA